ncbi:ABC transporter ATP-binding protein [Rhizobium sp. ACO-34A]|nr:OsmC family protein [Rhizobium sp. ACO-34A]ATN36076.1 ABC transporter ATP-binding protein [Rhizobium sp. ACO-34A]
MTELKTRQTGATATLGHRGFPHVVSATGGELDIVTGPSQPGFNPVDLLYASLAACLAMSARIAATQMQVMDKVTNITAEVKGEKAHEGPSRVTRFDVRITIAGDVDAETRLKIIHAAEEICTVSNTLAGSPEFSIEAGD